MPIVEKLIAPHKLEEYMRQEVDQLLTQRGIHDLSHYAGLARMGLTRWIEDPPMGWDFGLANTSLGRPLSEFPALEPWQVQLCESNQDFEGALEMARLSIGLALFHGELLQSWPFRDDDFFELHTSGALVNLVVAGDRIRDVFVTAMFRTTFKDYVRGAYNGAQRNRYVTPFDEARDKIAPQTNRMRSALDRLPALAREVEGLKSLRNKAIHEIATKAGRFERQRISEPRRPHPQADRSFREMHQELFAQHRARVMDNLASACKWYLLLVDVADLVFVAEQVGRGAAQP